MDVVITTMVLLTFTLFIICCVMSNIENNGNYKSINAQISTVPDDNIPNNNNNMEVKQKEEESKYLNIKAMDLVVYMLKLTGIYSRSYGGGHPARVELIKYNQTFLCAYLYFITIDYYKKTGKYLLKEDFLTKRGGVFINGLHEKYLAYINWLDENKVPVDFVPKGFMKEVVEEANKNINIIVRALGLGNASDNERFKATLLPTIEDNPIHKYDDSFLTRVNVEVLNDIIDDICTRYMQDSSGDYYWLFDKITDDHYDNAWIITMRKCTGEDSWFHFESYGYVIPKELIMKCADK